MVTRAEERLARNRNAVFVTAMLPQAVAPLAAVAPILRGACSHKDERSEGAWRRLILDFRATPAILTFVNGAEAARYSQAGVVTPDHTIRTKNWPLLLRAARGRPDGCLQARRAARGAAASSSATRTISRATMRASARSRRMLDPLPRVALVPGLGLFGLGRTKKDARIAADIAEAAIATITDAEAIGRFESIPEADMFDMEYWSLEQAKLGTAEEKPLAGQIAVVTGAAGVIGTATAKAFAAAGAEVALLDLDETAVQAKAKTIGGDRARAALRRDRRRLGARRLRPGGGDLRRRRHRGVERRRGLAGPHRRGRRGGAAQELRAQFLRPPARRAGGREGDAGARHRRLPVVQRVQAGGQSGR